MYHYLNIAICCCLPLLPAAQPTVLPHAHAHNDYAHERPLFDALDQGFNEVEADVFLIDGELYVAHVRPLWKNPARTLRQLYLEPLKARVAANQGRVFPGTADCFYLMIDFKTNGDSTYRVLRQQLEGYRDILGQVRDTTVERDKPIRIFISGNRPSLALLWADQVQPAALDGRPGDLGKGIPAAQMPVVSTPYKNVLRWKGRGKAGAEDVQNLQLLVRNAHAEGKKVRLWGIPDRPKVWRFLLKNGVDLINTDCLTEFAAFMKKQQAIHHDVNTGID